jgi:hypothetical protein
MPELVTGFGIRQRMMHLAAKTAQKKLKNGKQRQMLKFSTTRLHLISAGQADGHGWTRILSTTKYTKHTKFMRRMKWAKR